MLPFRQTQNEIVYLKAIVSYIRGILTTFVWKVFQESSLLHNGKGLHHKIGSIYISSNWRVDLRSITDDLTKPLIS